jgi:hypothetical protein
MKISVPAWTDNRYVSLAELLQLIGKFYPGKDWLVRVEEVAPEPGAERLEAVNADLALQLSELQALVSPDIQLVEGEITARDNKGICLRLTAVDGTSWDIETNDEFAVSTLVSAYPDASEIED